jgi:hypothetical protein
LSDGAIRGFDVAHAKVILSSLVQDSRDYGSDDEHMVSRAFLDLQVDGSMYEKLYAQIKQPVGGDFETMPLEVSWPVGYKGPLNYEAFRAGIEAYYRGLVHSTGSDTNVEGGSNIRMQNNRFVSPASFEFEIDSSNDG